MPTTSAAARRYAKAIFAIAREDGTVEETGRELAALDGLLRENSELHDVLLRPLHPAAQRRAVVKAVAERLGAGERLQSFCAFLVDQRRLVDFPAIHAEYQRLAAAAEGRLEARVRSAAPLDEGARERLAAALAARTGGEVTLHVDVDPDLIGGVVAQVGDLVFDGSLRTQLQQLRGNLARD
jgi:F-type H+-transporting ATPase subunit delta